MRSDAAGRGGTDIPLLDAYLAETRAEVDRVLAEMPDNRLQARRVITREWGFDPRPEELQTIAKIAHDDLAQGSLRELSRTTLTLRLLADRELRELLDTPDLASERIEEIAGLLPGLQRTIRELENEVRSTVESLAAMERDFVLQVGNALLPGREALLAAEVLAPRLGRLSRATNLEELRAAVPEATADELALLSGAFLPRPDAHESEEDEPQDSPSRVCIDALALRAVIADDLAVWERARSMDADDERTERMTVAILERLKRDKTAYHVISERLQNHQDTALVAGLGRFADKMRQIQRGLFSTYLKLAAVLNQRNAAADHASEEDGPERAEREIEQLLEESRAQDAIAEKTKKTTTDELYLNALKSVKAPAAAKTGTPELLPESVSTRDPRKERIRIRVLGSIAGVLLIATIGVHAHRISGQPDPLRVPVAELPETLILTNPVAVGPMMYAEISHWSWDDMNDAERQRSVMELGEGALAQGYETMYLVDENDRQLAYWSKISGVEIVAEPEPSDPPGS